MQKNVLIVSNTGDAHTDYLVKTCNRLGAACFRFNTDRFRKAGNVIWDICAKDGTLSIDDRRCVLSDVDLLIYRRPEPFHQLRKDIEPWVGRLLDFEWSAIENALSRNIRGIVMNPLNGSALAQNKIIHMQAAKEAGLNVPETLITTDIDKLKSFSKKHACITKGIVNAYVISGGLLRSAHTSRVSPDDFENYNPEGCPTLLQQEIKPQAIWRMVTVGDNVLGVRFSGSKLLEEIDSRLVDQDLHGEHAPVPNETKEKLISLCRNLGIVFASSDVIEDENGRLWFIDLNPEGQWAFLEEKFKVPISDEIIKLSGI